MFAMLHFFFFFFFNDTATTEIYTLSLHDALPICYPKPAWQAGVTGILTTDKRTRSEEHTSELQSPCNLVCRLLLEKKKHWYQSVTLPFSRVPEAGDVLRDWTL